MYFSPGRVIAHLFATDWQSGRDRSPFIGAGSNVLFDKLLRGMHVGNYLYYLFASFNCHIYVNAAMPWQLNPPNNFWALVYDIENSFFHIWHFEKYPNIKRKMVIIQRILQY